MKQLKTFLLVTITLGSLFLISCSKEKIGEKEIIRPVRYKKVMLSGGNLTRSFSGVSKAGVEVKLSFKVSGTLKSINVKIGDKIKKGKLIASLDKIDLQLRYEQAKVALHNAEVQMNSAQSTFERTSALYENNNISLQDYEQVRTAYESAKAAVKSNKRGLQLANSQLNYTNLFAPMDGIVVKVDVEKNENVMPGQVVVEINSGNDLEVTVGMPESYIARIKEGEKVVVHFPSLADIKFEGIISEVSYAINTESSTYPVSVILTNPSKDIRPGMATEVTFHFKSKGNKASLFVPIHTVAEDQKGRFVYTVSEEANNFAKVHKKSVKIGEITKEGIEVTDGLKDGDLIVTAGISKLSDGMKVKLLK